MAAVAVAVGVVVVMVVVVVVINSKAIFGSRSENSRRQD